MKKNELVKLVESLKDDDEVNETISKSELGKALMEGGLTLDAFKTKLNDPDFKAFMDSEKDTHSNKALETWKKNNLQKLVDDEYYKKHPEDTNDPIAKELADLKKKYEESEKARKLEIAKANVAKQLTDKKMPTGLADFIVNEDETTTNANLTSFEKIFKEHDKTLKEDFVNGHIYTPGGGDGGNGKNGEGSFAKKIAEEANRSNVDMSEARNEYFK